MGQRKYLIFLIIIFYPKISSSSPWLPPLGGYKYSTTTLTIDQNSNSLKNQRILLFKAIEQQISILLVKKSFIQNSKLRNKQLLQKLLDKKIVKLKRALVELTSFSERKIIITEFEQGIYENTSLGILLLSKYNSFTNSIYISTKDVFEERIANIFYKYKIFQNKKYIFTISPQIFIKSSSLFGDEYHAELSFSQGMSKKKELFETFIENSWSLGTQCFESKPIKVYYNFSISEGIKFNNGIILSNYTKYAYNKHITKVYQRTVYEQISIAKLFKYKNSNLKELMFSLGYFWNYSLVNKNYKNSGFICSVIITL